MALPAIADLRRRFAGARLMVGARRSVAGLYALVPGVDGIIPLGLPDDSSRIRAAAPDLAILFPNSFASAWLAKRAGVLERWGYATDLRRPLLTRVAARPRAGVHQGAYYQHLVRELGVENGPLEPSVHVPKPIVDTARRLLIDRGWDGTRPLAVVAPGAAYGTAKRWPPAYFAALSADLVGTRQMHVVYVGSAADRETTRWVARVSAPEAARFVTDLAGVTPLESLGGILRLARVCISNDSGTMHFAVAAGVPVAALFGPTRERETAPLPGPGGRARVLINPVWCRPCMLRECPIDHRCMKGLAPTRVLEAVDELTTHVLTTPVGPVLPDRPGRQESS
jgi:heptosyltransferase-2